MTKLIITLLLILSVTTYGASIVSGNLKEATLTISLSPEEAETLKPGSSVWIKHEEGYIEAKVVSINKWFHRFMAKVSLVNDLK